MIQVRLDRVGNTVVANRGLVFTLKFEIPWQPKKNMKKKFFQFKKKIPSFYATF